MQEQDCLLNPRLQRRQLMEGESTCRAMRTQIELAKQRDHVIDVGLHEVDQFRLIAPSTPQAVLDSCTTGDRSIWRDRRIRVRLQDLGVRDGPVNHAGQDLSRTRTKVPRGIRVPGIESEERAVPARIKVRIGLNKLTRDLGLA